MASRAPRYVLMGLGAAVLLWAGFGSLHRSRPLHHAEWLSVDGVSLRAVRAGRGDTTLIFLHGYGESLLAWRFLLDRFAQRYRVLAIDLPGFGMSGIPDGPHSYTAYQQWLDDLITRQTRGPLVVVGHSLGGQLAAGLALAHPERVVAAVLIAPAGAGISPLLSDSAGIASPATQWVASALSYVLPIHDSAWLIEAAIDSAVRSSSDSPTVQTQRRILEQFDFAAIGDRYRDLHQPVLLIWGRQDPTIPFTIGERIATLLPCRRFVPLLALHRPHQTVPDTVAAEMRAFLRHPMCDPK
ncbi:MAG TPA: alpha/beta fold hydrolase [Gemmatimonadales bacterium]